MTDTDGVLKKMSDSVSLKEISWKNDTLKESIIVSFSEMIKLKKAVRG